MEMSKSDWLSHHALMLEIAELRMRCCKYLIMKCCWGTLYWVKVGKGL